MSVSGPEIRGKNPCGDSSEELGKGGVDGIEVLSDDGVKGVHIRTSAPPGRRVSRLNGLI